MARKPGRELDGKLGTREESSALYTVDVWISKLWYVHREQEVTVEVAQSYIGWCNILLIIANPFGTKTSFTFIMVKK